MESMNRNSQIYFLTINSNIFFQSVEDQQQFNEQEFQNYSKQKV